MVSSVSIYQLGVGTSGAKKFWHTCFVLLVDERRYLIDCPRNFFRMLTYNEQHGSLTVELSDCHDIILTHLHFDHADGLVEIAHSDQLQEDLPLNLYAPAGTLDYLWSQRVERGIVSAAQVEGGNATLDRCFRKIALDNPQPFDDFKLSFRPTIHIPNTVAYRFEFGDFTLGYSADTAFDESLIAWFDTCDFVVHDVLLPPWSNDDFARTLHAPLSQMLKLPVSFQQKTLLCHYDEDAYLAQDIGEYRHLAQNTLHVLT